MERRGRIVEQRLATELIQRASAVIAAKTLL
jgi:hypothetical protein